MLSSGQPGTGVALARHAFAREATDDAESVIMDAPRQFVYASVDVPIDAGSRPLQITTQAIGSLQEVIKIDDL